MEKYRRRLEHTQIKICVLLLLLLFGGLLILPWIGQVVWIAVIMATYIRLIIVIARKEEVLEELQSGAPSNGRRGTPRESVATRAVNPGLAELAGFVRETELPATLRRISGARTLCSRAGRGMARRPLS
jgi:hypothetical protein